MVISVIRVYTTIGTLPYRSIQPTWRVPSRSLRKRLRWNRFSLQRHRIVRQDGSVAPQNSESSVLLNDVRGVEIRSSSLIHDLSGSNPRLTSPPSAHHPLQCGVFLDLRLYRLSLSLKRGEPSFLSTGVSRLSSEAGLILGRRSFSLAIGRQVPDIETNNVR